MKIIKAIAFACMILFTLIAGKCFVVSSFDNNDDDDDREGLTIVLTNAETTSSEVVQSLTQTLTVADIASQSAQYVNDVVVSDPLSYSCDNPSGVIILTIKDLDRSNRVSVGDDLLLRYTNCSADNVIVNGDLMISVLDAKGIYIGHFESGSDWLFTLSVNASSFKVRTENKVFIVNGEMEIALQFNATTALLETKITNNTLALDSGSQSIISAMDISQLINFAIVPSSYSLTINSLKISSGAQSGTFNATTKSYPLSGMELLDLSEYFIDLHLPENGVINISGKNSNADVSIMPDEWVSIDIDIDGDSISDAVISSTWSEIN